MKSEPAILFDTGEKYWLLGKKLVWRLAAGSAAAIFGAAILLMSLLAVTNPSVVHPSTTELNITEKNPVSTASGEKIEYFLPYPGMLPDSPLYKIKMIRDRVMLWLTWDLGTKIDRELMYADKRINAAVFLVEGGKKELGVTTATKAEIYLQRAMGNTIEMSINGEDVKSRLMVFEKAAAKHAEILRILEEKVNSEERTTLEEARKVTEMMREKVGQTLKEAK